MIKDKSAIASVVNDTQSTTIPYKNYEAESGESEQENTGMSDDLLSSICEESDIVNISFEIITII